MKKNDRVLTMPKRAGSIVTRPIYWCLHHESMGDSPMQACCEATLIGGLAVNECDWTWAILSWHDGPISDDG